MKPFVLHLNDLATRRFVSLRLKVIPSPFPKSSLTVIHECLPSWRELPPVMHKSTTELIYCLKGRFTVTLGKKRRQLHQGHIVWIPPRTWHQFITQKSSAEALSIFYPALTLGKNPDVVVKN